MFNGILVGSSPSAASSPRPLVWSVCLNKNQQDVKDLDDEPTASDGSPWLQPAAAVDSPGEDDQEDEDDRAMVRVTRSRICGGCPHPAVLCEPPAIASAQLPLLSEKDEVMVPRQLAVSGALSSTQVETIAFAARRFREKLPCGARGGYVLGDGTGCGKGRCIAALLLDQWNRGFRRSLWLSVSADLAEDAERDLRDIGAPLPLCRLGRVPAGQSLDGAGAACAELDKLGAERAGVLFATYSLLVAGSTGSSCPSSRPERSRFGQIVSWMRGSANSGGGLIVFDEAHRAKNLQDPSKGQRVGTKVGLFVDDLQRLLPECAVLYASATCATEVRHLAYMRRLGLWGDGQARFRGFGAFRESVERGGVPAMEMLAVRLRSEGLLSCRSLSFEGTTFETAKVPLSRSAEVQYDAACLLWHDVLDLVRKFRDDPKLSRTPAKHNDALFWATQQRFFKCMLVAAKVKMAVQLSRSALRKGESIVISLWSTQEARTQERLRSLADGDLVDEHLSGPEMILSHYIDQHLPTADSSRQRVEWAERAVKNLRLRLADLDLPPNPIDELIDGLGGPDRVAEMTGRSQRVVVGTDGRKRLRARRADTHSMESANLIEQRNFQSGRKQIAIITEAASSGISLHCDNSLAAVDSVPRRRCMICIELPWAADKAMQQFGRVHRSNQVIPPRYVLVTTELPGEQRFVSALAHRMRLLGAVTRGDQAAPMHVGGLTEAHDMHGEYGKIALKTLLESVRSGIRPMHLDLMEMPSLEQHWGGDWSGFATQAYASLELAELGDVDKDAIWHRRRKDSNDGEAMTRFLNRMLLMRCATQRSLFEALFAILSARRRMDEQSGQLADGGLQSLTERVRARRVEQVCREPIAQGRLAFTTLRVDRGMSWEEAIARAQARELVSPEGFWDGKEGPTLVLQRSHKNHDASNAYYVLYRPSECVVRCKGLPITIDTFRDLVESPYSLSEEAVASKLATQWKRDYDSSGKACAHAASGALGRRKKTCMHCRRFDEVLLVTGDDLMTASGVIDSFFEHRAPIVRARNLIGVVVPSRRKAELRPVLEAIADAASRDLDAGAALQEDISDSSSDGAFMVNDDYSDGPRLKCASGAQGPRRGRKRSRAPRSQLDALSVSESDSDCAVAAEILSLD